jgi:hypothetical protein
MGYKSRKRTLEIPFILRGRETSKGTENAMQDYYTLTGDIPLPTTMGYAFIKIR